MTGLKESNPIWQTTEHFPYFIACPMPSPAPGFFFIGFIMVTIETHTSNRGAKPATRCQIRRLIALGISLNKARKMKRGRAVKEIERRRMIKKRQQQRLAMQAGENEKKWNELLYRLNLPADPNRRRKVSRQPMMRA